MANLAIKGHSKRGKEVIEILKMLGGCNSKYSGYDTDFCYYINKFNNIECHDKSKFEKYIVLTLEEFLEKYPYKIGDEVINDEGDIVKIFNMRWSERVDEIYYSVILHDDIFEYPADILQPYKKEPMKEKENSVVVNIEHKQLKVNSLRFDKTQLVINDEYELKQEEGEYYIVRKNPQYPKTYDECCKVLEIQSDWHLTFELNNPAPHDLCVTNEFDYICKLEGFRKLLICRDAYWKIAGEEMGLGKPWEPDWTNYNEFKFVIGVLENEIIKCYNTIAQYILAFPTEEMRDVFFENFKELIEICKELL